jgi:hypothetical protein
MTIHWRQEFYGWEPVEKGFFSTEDFIALNSNTQLIKYDPKVIELHPPLIAASLSRLFPDFSIIQFPQASMYRPFPLRVIYSKSHGKIFELKSATTPFFELMRYLKNIGSVSESWVDKKLYDYIVLVMDNSRGRHGRFEMLDFKRTQVPVHDQFINRINNHFALAEASGTNTAEEVMNNYHKRFKGILKNELPMPTLLDTLRKAIHEFFDDQQLKPVGTTNDTKSISDVFTVFKNSLFKSDFLFSTAHDTFGELRLRNEVLYSIGFKNDDGGINARIFLSDEKTVANSEDELVIDDFPPL